MSSQRTTQHPSWVAYEPDLVPPLELMQTEGIDVLEEWFRWAEEWSVFLRVYGRLTRTSDVLEIGCGLGRVAFPLRYILTPDGSYEGFDVSREKIEFLQQAYRSRYPQFQFRWDDVHNSCYNPQGTIRGESYRFPYPDRSFDLVFAASVFTHMAPSVAANYMQETARVLKPEGRCVMSFFLLDAYEPGRPRPFGFARDGFNFDHTFEDHPREDFAIADPDDHERMTAYSRRFITQMAADAGLAMTQEPVPGLWSGGPSFVGAQDLIVLGRAPAT